MNWKRGPAYIYLFKVNNRNKRKRCEIWSKLTKDTEMKKRTKKKEMKESKRKFKRKSY